MAGNADNALVLNWKIFPQANPNFIVRTCDLTQRRPQATSDHHSGQTHQRSQPALTYALRLWCDVRTQLSERLPFDRDDGSFLEHKMNTCA